MANNQTRKECLMDYGITLWAYLSEPLGHKCLSLTEKPQYRVLKSHITVTYVLREVSGEVYRNIACEKIADL